MPLAGCLLIAIVESQILYFVMIFLQPYTDLGA